MVAAWCHAIWCGGGDGFAFDAFTWTYIRVFRTIYNLRRTYITTVFNPINIIVAIIIENYVISRAILPISFTSKAIRGYFSPTPITGI
jgi:hypothetical protein